MNIPMSVFRLITSGIGGKAAVDRDRRLRRELTQSGHEVFASVGGLWHGIAAIHEHDLPGYKVGSIGGKISNHVTDVAGFAKPANWI
jgi:hypothetical protein